MMYIKLKAQRLLIGKNSKAFLVSILPFLMTLVLCCLNYYLLFYFIKNENFNTVLNVFAVTIIGVFSLFIRSCVVCCCENYFYRKATSSFVPIRVKDLFCSFATRILKFLLFWFLLAVFFLPSAVMLYTAIFVSNGKYPEDVSTTLFVSSAIMALVGASCFFLVFKRFSKSYFVQFSTGETNPFKVLSQSAELMEGNLIRYSLFCLSFLGWDAVCLALVPIIYVLPYRKSAKYVFFDEKKKSKPQFVESEKPIVFIFSNS